MLDLYKKRRSVRKFTEEKISEEDKATILKAALLAPTGMSKRHIEYICIEDKQEIENLVNFKAHSTGPFKTASLAIMILGDSAISDTWVEDTSIAAIYMQLAVEKLGLGSTWIQMRMRSTPNKESSDVALRNHFGFPEDKKVLCILAIGHKNEFPTPYTDDYCDFSKIHYGKY